MSIQGDTEIQLAQRIVRVLDGVSIKDAQSALARAGTLLLTTQIVHADSVPLAIVAENDATFNG